MPTNPLFLMAQLGMTDQRSYAAYQHARCVLQAQGWHIKRFGKRFEVFRGNDTFECDVWGLILWAEKPALSETIEIYHTYPGEDTHQ